MPDGWVIVKIVGEKGTHYRVFGSWRGGFAQGDSWRMNSGIINCVFRDGYYAFEGASGSVYACAKVGYGRLGAYNSAVLGDYVAKSEGMLTVMDDMEDWTTVVWETK